MRAFLIGMFLAGLAAAAPAVAGPWPRAPGGAFVSGSVGTEGHAGRRARIAEVYAEYGLTRRLTLGGHLHLTRATRRGDIFARWHPDLPGPTALGLTLGGRFDSARDPRLAPLLAVHLGRGAETRLGNLWARVDLRAVGSREGLGGIAEMELTGQLGLRTEAGALAMLTLSEYRDRHGATRKLIPALGHAIGARSTLVLSATTLPRERRLDGFTLSLWQAF